MDDVWGGEVVDGFDGDADFWEGEDDYHPSWDSEQDDLGDDGPADLWQSRSSDTLTNETAEALTAGTVVPPGDYPFSSEQLADWREVEKAAGISNSSKGGGGTSKNETLCTATAPDESCEFLAAKAKITGLDGWVFRNGELGLGVYRDIKPSVAHAPSGIENFECHERTGPQTEEQQPPASATVRQRARDHKGRRIRTLPRCKRLKKAMDNAKAVCAHISIGDGWHKGNGLWAFETANANSLKSLEEHVLARTAADVLFAQETRLLGDDKIAASSITAGKKAWAANLGAAQMTETGRASGGCAILATVE